MTRFVVLETRSFPGGLHARVRLATGTTGHVRCATVVDEHFVVDVDTCGDGRLLDCADVLQGSRAAHSVADAMRRLTDLTSAHPAYGIAAIPLADVAGTGGWAVAGGGPARASVLVPYGPYPASGERSLLPSCLHAWLVAGRSLREWPCARNAPAD
ncbi:hypothetical protein [Streptomyces sp. NPDC006645]|uniref:hypothetical protein n=1 Tax=unclassified Streptomyces TaxID=2593676 RepID=UPI0033ADCE70